MREKIRHAIEAEGLVFIGVAPLEVSHDYGRFEEWLSEGKHAGMEYLARNNECRRNPERLLEGARAAIVMALPYDLGDKLEPAHPPRVAQYARLSDYHRVLWKKGEKIAALLADGAPGSFRVVVDSAPLLERAMASRAGSGFIGKNTCYIHPDHGSFLLLAEILTTIELPLDDRAPFDSRRRTSEGGCGTCNLCQVQCPTGALDKDYTIDARKCLAYWTIEHRGPIPEEYWPHLGKYYFGCDLCQLACPYTRKHSGHSLPSDLQERPMPSLFDTAVMGQREYESYFGGTPLTRAKRGGLRRNALIAMFVTGHPRLEEAMEIVRKDAESPVGETLEQMLALRQAAGEVFLPRQDLHLDLFG